MKLFRDIEQGTDEWKRLRKGKPTASRFSDIITAARGELSKSADGYIRELIGECFCPDWEPWQGNFATERGKDLEGPARDALIAETGLNFKQVGFVLADDGVCGCSPDGLVFDAEGTPICGGEIKCPIPKTHISYVMEGGLPDDYKQQVHGSMAVTGLDEWHFWSFFPGMRHHHVIVKRDEYTAKIQVALAQFVARYKEVMAVAKVKLSIAEIKLIS